MKECILCTRDMSKSNNILGQSCLKKAYDFTELQKLQEYLNKGWLGAAAAFSNNFASLATSCNVVHEYDITIKFSIKDW